MVSQDMGCGPGPSHCMAVWVKWHRAAEARSVAILHARKGAQGPHSGPQQTVSLWLAWPGVRDPCPARGLHKVPCGLTAVGAT